MEHAVADKVLHLRLPEELVERLRVRAGEEERTIRTTAERAIRAYLDAAKKPK